MMMVGAVMGLMACGKGEPTAVKTPEPTRTSGATGAKDDNGTNKVAKSGEHTHGADHKHGSPHGGQVVSAGRYHLEGVPTKAGLLVFLLDEHEKELPLTGVKGSMTFVGAGKAPVDVSLDAMGNHLHGHVNLEGKWSAAVTVDKNGEKLVARFEGEGAKVGGGHEHGGHGDHAGHDHGGHGNHAGHDPGGHGDHADHAVGHAHLALSEDVKLVVEHGPIALGQPVKFTFKYVDKAGQPVTDFEVVHEEKLHLFFVSDDLMQYDHVHPVLDQATGTFTWEQTFKVAGAYGIYSDFKSTRLGATLVRTPLTVPGEAPAKAPLTVDTVMERTEGETTVKLEATPSPIEAGGDVMLKYTLSTAAGPVTDIEPYLGAMGHLFIIHEDLVTLAHSHPKGPEPTKDMRGGPVVEFHTVLPKAGKYKAWVQFQRQGKLYTMPWVVEAVGAK
jgi:hypothetical protein